MNYTQLSDVVDLFALQLSANLKASPISRAHHSLPDLPTLRKLVVQSVQGESEQNRLFVEENVEEICKKILVRMERDSGVSKTSRRIQDIPFALFSRQAGERHLKRHYNTAFRKAPTPASTASLAHLSAIHHIPLKSLVEHGLLHDVEKDKLLLALHSFSVKSPLPEFNSDIARSSQAFAPPLRIEDVVEEIEVLTTNLNLWCKGNHRKRAADRARQSLSHCVTMWTFASADAKIGEKTKKAAWRSTFKCIHEILTIEAENLLIEGVQNFCYKVKYIHKSLLGNSELIGTSNKVTCYANYKIAKFLYNLLDGLKEYTKTSIILNILRKFLLVEDEGHALIQSVQAEDRDDDEWELLTLQLALILRRMKALGTSNADIQNLYKDCRSEARAVEIKGEDIGIDIGESDPCSLLAFSNSTHPISLEGRIEEITKEETTPVLKFTIDKGATASKQLITAETLFTSHSNLGDDVKTQAEGDVFMPEDEKPAQASSSGEMLLSWLRQNTESKAEGKSQTESLRTPTGKTKEGNNKVKEQNSPRRSPRLRASPSRRSVRKKRRTSSSKNK